ncbi:MAG: efflux RND transporter periplasmic adaptor subunit, partial [Xanthomonadales bacterium]|nr:efflux RND transporter periplasmic adaptor subunit [Xanthomonadales bacterium]
MQKRTQRLVRIAIAAAVVIAAATGIKLWLFPAKAAASYVTAPVTVADIEDTVIATGELEALNLVSVGAQVSGRVVALKVAVGDVVTAGQLIAEIDSLPQQNTLRNAEAALQTTQAQRAARVAALRQAELAFKRQQDMLAGEATSRAEYETAEATLATTRADIAALDAQLAQGKIQVDTARLNLGYTKITAPIDGTIVAVVTKEGQTVNANQSAPTIVKLARLDTLTVKAQISEADVPKVKAGQKVWFTILGEPDRRYYAELRAVEPAPESIASESSSTSSSSSSSTAIYYNGLFDVPNPEGRLRIAMTAQVNIVLAEAKDALTVPSSALGAAQRAEGPTAAGGEGMRDS